jgi:hypothetical protein
MGKSFERTCGPRLDFQNMLILAWIYGVSFVVVAAVFIFGVEDEFPIPTATNRRGTDCYPIDVKPKAGWYGGPHLVSTPGEERAEAEE